MSWAEIKQDLEAHGTSFRRHAIQRRRSLFREQKLEEKRWRKKHPTQKKQPPIDQFSPETIILLSNNGQDHFQEALNNRFKTLWQQAQKRYHQDLASTGDAR